MKLSRVGIDLAENVYQLHGVDRHGKTVWKRRLKRHQWFKALLDTAGPECEIGMEACAGAHHWGRELQSRGYTVKLIPPQFVKPYVKSNKSDAKDAEAICEAMSRPNMRFVTAKKCRAAGHSGDSPHPGRVDHTAHGQGQPGPRAGGRVRSGGTEAYEFTSCCDPVLARRCGERSDGRLPQLVAWSVERSAYAG